MDCAQIPQLGYGVFSERLHQKLANQRYPIFGSVELTFRCNLRCVHCYVTGAAQDCPAQNELTVTELDNLFAQMAEEGCFWLLLTGGEPLLRQDFSEIYISAKRKGMLINLFTNGTLITRTWRISWRIGSPSLIEITIYGRTQATYERITGVPGLTCTLHAGRGPAAGAQDSPAPQDDGVDA